jgi:SCY1-like protein 2
MSQDNRLDSQKLLASHLFADIQIRSLRYLAELEIKETVKKAQFLKNLPNIINDFPDRILFQKVLPPVLRELNDLKVTSFALPNVLAITEKMSPELFIHRVLPVLAKCFTYDEPPNIPLTLLKSFSVLLEKTTPLEQKNCLIFTFYILDLIPFLLKCLDSSYPDVEIEVLKKAEDCVSSKLIGYLQFKTHLLPKIDSLCRRTPYSSVRVNCVVCLGRVSSILDKDSLIGVVSPLLDHCLKIDDSPTLLMSVVGVYSRIAKQCDTHYISQRVLPALLPIAMSKSFNLDQFTKYMKTVKGLLEVVEIERLDVLKKEDALQQVNQSNQGEDMDEILEKDFQKKPVKNTPKEKAPVEEPKVSAPVVPSGFDDGFDVSDYEQKTNVETPQFDKLLNQFENPGMRKAPESLQPTTTFGGSSGFDSPTFGGDDAFKTTSTPAFDDLLNK